MTALIPIREDDGQQAVSGRDLHAFLEVGARYNDWFARMVEYGFAEGQDYTLISEYVRSEARGRDYEQTDHILTLDMAKELAMIQRTPKGKQARQYFIEVEKRARAAAVPQSLPEALRAYALEVEARETLEAKVAQDAPKVEYVEQFVDRDDVATFRSAASELGIGEKDLRTRLAEAGWIYRLKIGRRWSETEGRLVDENEWRAKAAHGEKFALRPQHNAPRHHNGQVRQTLYVRQTALPSICRVIERHLMAVSA